MGFGRAGFYFWYEVAGSVTVTGLQVPDRGRSGPQKSQPEPSLLSSTNTVVSFQRCCTALHVLSTENTIRIY